MESNTPSLDPDGVPDMTMISDIDEDRINKNLKTRYCRNHIYTYTGTILVAVNPYKELGIYTTDHVFRYHGSKLGSLEPHVFALAEAAYSSLQTLEENQSCVISGESGAGKTETTKFILQYLCSVTSDVSTWVEQQILEANTILEAFGNAKTVRNDNSSRFGKFMQVCFNNKWMIRGCIIQDYLLEQSRITFQSPGERNYHVFYQLVEGAKGNKDLVQQFKLRPAEFYNYLNQSGCIRIDGVNDAMKFDALRLAFSILRIPLNMCDGIFCVLSAILWLGNTTFQDIDGEKCQLTEEDKETLLTVASLLGLKVDDVIQVTLLRQINVRGNITEIPLKLQEARENRHAMAKALYSRTFAWLVNHINICTNPGQDSTRFLGVLDIFGFENFAINSFEQLCINYTNEKLHKFFNHYVFALEQEIYRQEEIQFSHIQFSDNTLCLELIEKPPRCILKLLTEQCHMPKGSDTAYLVNLHSEFDNHSNYLKGDDRRKWELEFGIKHYAGSVTYTVSGFVDKNRDVQQDVFFDFMSRSSNAFVKELTKFQDLLSTTTNRMGNVGNTTVQRGTMKGKPTVSDTFRQQLQALVDVLQATNPWYVRCIKPNMVKAANDFDDKLVLDQLKYLGMLEIIRIRKDGYPIHMTFQDFVNRYQCITKKKLPTNHRDGAQLIMRLMMIDAKLWQLGKSKMFLQHKAHEPIEDLRMKILSTKSIIIQRNWRRYTHRKEYLLIKNAIIKIQNAYRSWKLRIEFLRKRRAVIVIQSHLRGLFAREVAAALREMRRVEEEMRKKEKIQKEKLEKENKEKDKIDGNFGVGETQNDDGEVTRCNEQQIVALAEHLNTKLQESSTHESVDLDNLFSFLTDVQNGNGRSQIIEKLGEKMKELVTDLDMELETVLQQELEGIHAVHEKNNNQINPPSTLDLSQQSSLKGASLPAPTCPPPPPPQEVSEMNTTVEPIYESVLPREENGICNSPPPLPEPPYKINVKSPSMERIQRSEKSSPVTAILSPRQSRPNSRASSTGGQWRHNDQVEDSEREQRRKFRVEKKLQELEGIKEKIAEPPQEVYHDIVEFAQKHFNTHEKFPDGTIMATLTRKGKSMELIPKYEMVTYYKGSSIPTSHVHMYDPDNTDIACNIFKDLCKYMRGEIKSDCEHQVIQSIIGFGIEREELRDEIYVQCMRQATNNPSLEATENVWLLLCLAVVAFQPSKSLYKYFVCFLKKNLQCDGKLHQYVQWCLDNCKNMKVSCRKYPPSVVEIAAMRRLGTIVCRFFFLDGRTKAIDIHPTDTASDASAKLADKLGLQSLDGWAIYQSSADGEEHVRGHSYLYDVISAWEVKQNKQPNSSFPILNRRCSSSAVASSENRFIFKRRLFRSTREMSQDPVEISLLYAQAVYSVVKCDDFPVNEKVAVQLAGLQAQVSLGDPKDKLDYYTDIDVYLPYRISKSRGNDVWVTIIAQAHKQYGTGKSEIIAKVLYLSCVMQYKLYGTTIFPVTYRGYWSYGNTLLLGINADGLMLMKSEDKLVLYEFPYYDIESIFLDPSDSFLTINLMRHHNDNGSQKCFVFETLQKSEIGSLIVSYHPSLAAWITDHEPMLRTITSDDRTRLYRTVVECRRCLVDAGILNRPQEGAGKLIKNTIRRFSKQRLEKLWNENGFSEYSETYKGYSLTYWAFSRQQLVRSLCKLPTEDETIAIEMFKTLLTYAGLYQNGETIRRSEEEHISLIQNIVEKAMRKDGLMCELYMQLIKQTTEHPDPNSRVNLRHWAILSLACSFGLPKHRNVKKYLFAHLKKCSSDCITEEGKYARFAEKCAMKTQGTQRRHWPPSKEEIMCTINRRLIYARFHFMDGQYHAIEFHPSATASEVVSIIKNKIGLRESAMGYAIYEVLGNSEKSLLSDEKVADVMSKWEHYRNANTTGSISKGNTGKIMRKQAHLFLFKKHLFLDQYLNFDDPVEKELLYHQILHALRSDRFPVSEMESVMLTALQAQVELGDFNENIEDYRPIAGHCLPTRLAQIISPDAIAQYHQSLTSMTPDEAKKSFLNMIRSWPLHRSTIFDVMQSFTSNWPRLLWLAIDQVGLHLLEHRSRSVVCTYEYDIILSYSPALNCLMIITGNEKKQSKVILTTTQAFQIANLIREYTEILQKGPTTTAPVEVKKRDGLKSAQNNSGRPISILHKPAPLINSYS